MMISWSNVEDKWPIVTLTLAMTKKKNMQMRAKAATRSGKPKINMQMTTNGGNK